MNVKLDKKSEALLREMLRKNSRYGSVDFILNEAVGVFYASERKKGFRWIMSNTKLWAAAQELVELLKENEGARELVELLKEKTVPIAKSRARFTDTIEEALDIAWDMVQQLSAELHSDAVKEIVGESVINAMPLFICLVGI